MRPTRRALVKAVAGSLATFAVLGRNGHSLSQTADGGLFAPPQPFTDDFVLELARERAKKPYVEEKVTMPANWQSLTYDQYRDIRFNPDKSIWRGAAAWLLLRPVPFRLLLLLAGRHLRRRRTASRRSSTIVPDLFTFGPLVPKPTGEADLHYAGFRLRYPINSKDYFDEFCVFQGASYFRAIGKGHLYGLSARGLAIDTGQPQGEEFPFFRAFWIEDAAAGCGHGRRLGAARQPFGDRRLSASPSSPARRRRWMSR